jgi:predicted esterase
MGYISLQWIIDYKGMLRVTTELTNVLNFLNATNNDYGLNLNNIIIAGFSAVVDIAKLQTYLKIILNIPIN